MYLAIAAALVVCAGAVLAALHRFVWKTGTVQLVTLPNGMRVKAVAGDFTTSLVYHELFIDNAYFRNGVRVPHAAPGAKPPLIVDVGANIGLFAVSTAQQLDSYRIRCFEPVPALHDMAVHNTRPFDKDERRRVDVTQIAVGSSVTQLSFDFDAGATAGASWCTQEVTGAFVKDAPWMAWVRAAVHDAQFCNLMPPGTARALLPALRVPYLGALVACVCLPVALFPLAIALLAKPSTKSVVKCDVKPLSLLLDDDDEPIALLKIDVEGAEWDVLQGISDATWRRVQQCVIETHDIDGRVQKVMDLLRRQGFAHVVKGVEELKLHELMRLETIFATRDRPAVAG